MFDGAFKQQAAFDLDALQRATRRSYAAAEAEQIVPVQHQAMRWTYLGSGISHPNFLRSVQTLSPVQAARLDEAAKTLTRTPRGMSSIDVPWPTDHQTRLIAGVMAGSQSTPTTGDMFRPAANLAARLERVARNARASACGRRASRQWHVPCGANGCGARTESRSQERIIANLYLALGAMTVQQTFATLGRSTVPLIAAAIVADLGLDPALVGVYVAIGAVAGFLTTMTCGGLIVRYGAMRMTQVGMLALAIGLALPAVGLAAAVRAGRLRRRTGAGDLDAFELAPARPPVAAAAGAAGLLDQADRRAGRPDGGGRGGAAAGDRSGLAHGTAGDRGACRR